MTDIFDQIDSAQMPKGDIFDQVASSDAPKVDTPDQVASSSSPPQRDIFDDVADQSRPWYDRAASAPVAMTVGEKINAGADRVAGWIGSAVNAPFAPFEHNAPPAPAPHPQARTPYQQPAPISTLGQPPQGFQPVTPANPNPLGTQAPTPEEPPLSERSLSEVPSSAPNFAQALGVSTPQLTSVPDVTSSSVIHPFVSEGEKRKLGNIIDSEDRLVGEMKNVTPDEVQAIRKRRQDAGVSDLGDEGTRRAIAQSRLGGSATMPEQPHEGVVTSMEKAPGRFTRGVVKGAIVNNAANIADLAGWGDAANAIRNQYDAGHDTSGIAGGLGDVAGNLAPIVALPEGGAAKAAVALYFGGQGAAQAAHEAEGLNLTPEQRKLYIVGNGLLNTLYAVPALEGLKKVPVLRGIIDKIGAKGVQAVLDKLEQKAATRIASRAAQGAAEFGGIGTGVSLGQSGLQSATGVDKDMTVAKAFGEAVQKLPENLIMGGVMHGGGEAVRSITAHFNPPTDLTALRRAEPNIRNQFRSATDEQLAEYRQKIRTADNSSPEAKRAMGKMVDEEVGNREALTQEGQSTPRTEPPPTEPTPTPEQPPASPPATPEASGVQAGAPTPTEAQPGGAGVSGPRYSVRPGEGGMFKVVDAQTGQSHPYDNQRMAEYVAAGQNKLHEAQQPPQTPTEPSESQATPQATEDAQAEQDAASRHATPEQVRQQIAIHPDARLADGTPVFNSPEKAQAYADARHRNLPAGMLDTQVQKFAPLGEDTGKWIVRETPLRPGEAEAQAKRDQQQAAYERAQEAERRRGLSQQNNQGQATLSPEAQRQGYNTPQTQAGGLKPSDVFKPQSEGQPHAIEEQIPAESNADVQQRPGPEEVQGQVPAQEGGAGVGEGGQTQGEKAVAEKQPWEMTQKEFQRDWFKKANAERKASGIRPLKVSNSPNPGIVGEHRAVLERALSEGHPAPPAVLADYPDLAKQYGKGAAPENTPLTTRGVREGEEASPQTGVKASGIDKNTENRYPTAFGKEFTSHGIRERKDPITGKSSAVGPLAEGYRAPSGHEGAPANGSDFPAPARARNAETHRGIEGAAEAEKRDAGVAEESLAGQNLVDDFLNPQDIADPSLRSDIEALHQHLAVIPHSKLETLPTLDTGSTEAQTVYVDKNHGAVYKLYKVEDGDVTEGSRPGELSPGGPSGDIETSLERHTPLLDYLRQVDTANRHGGAVFTEVAGFTNDGDLVLKQPYVTDLRDSSTPQAVEGARHRGFQPIRNTTFPAAVAHVEGKPHLFVDMSGQNVMRNRRGEPFLVDTTSRPLTDEEANRLDFEPKQQAQGQPTPAPDKYNLTPEDIQTAKPYTEGEVSPEFASGVRDYRDGKDKARGIKGMNKAGVDEARAGFAAAKANATPEHAQDRDLNQLTRPQAVRRAHQQGMKVNAKTTTADAIAHIRQQPAATEAAKPLYKVVDKDGNVISEHASESAAKGAIARSDEPGLKIKAPDTYHEALQQQAADAGADPAGKTPGQLESDIDASLAKKRTREGGFVNIEPMARLVDAGVKAGKFTADHIRGAARWLRDKFASVKLTAKAAWNALRERFGPTLKKVFGKIYNTYKGFREDIEQRGGSAGAVGDVAEYLKAVKLQKANPGMSLADAMAELRRSGETKPATIKQQIAEASGMAATKATTKDTVTKTKTQLLKERLREQAKREQAVEKVHVQMQAQLDRLKRKEAGGKEVRNAIYQAVRATLPKDMHPKYLRAVSKAKTPRDLENAIQRIQENVQRLNRARTIQSVRDAHAKGGIDSRDTKLIIDMVYDGKTPDEIGHALNQNRLNRDPEPIYPDGFGFPSRTIRRRLLTAGQDRLRAVYEAQQAIIKSKGGKLVWGGDGPQIPESEDTYLAAELRSRLSQNEIETAFNRYVRPMTAVLAKDGIELSNAQDNDPSPDHLPSMNTYVIARHAGERNAAMRDRAFGGLDELIPGLNDDPAFGSGMSDDLAEKILNTVDQSDKATSYKRAARLFDRMNKRYRNVLVESGLESQDTIDAWENLFEFHAPLKTDMEKYDPNAKPNRGIGQGFNISGKEQKRAKGRRTMADDPVVQAWMNLQNGIIRAHKNRVGQTFMRMVMANPDSGLWKVMGTDEKLPPSWKPFSLKVEGKDVHIGIGPRGADIATAMKNLGVEEQGWTMRQLGNGTRFLAALSTRWNPVFPPVNLARDAGGVAVTTSGEKGIADAAKITSRIPHAIAAIYNMERSGLAKRHIPADQEGYWNRMAQEYKDSGASISFLNLNNLENNHKRLKNELLTASTNKSPMRVAVDALHQYADYVGDLNDAVENGTRLSVFAQMRDRGMSPARAASYAKNISTNFERKGNAGAFINAVYMFSNATIQDVARVMSSAVRHKGTRRVLTGLFAASVGLDVLNHMIAGHDKDGENYYDKIPDYIKRNNIILPLWDDQGRTWMIPAPYGYNFIQALAQNASAAAMGRKTFGAAAWSVGGAAADAFNPLGGSDPDPIHLVTPTMAKPIEEVMNNRDWTGKSIYPDNPFATWQKPDSEQMWSGTPDWAAKLARGLNKIQGGDKYHSGGPLDVHPDAINHVWEALTGGTGKTISRTMNVADETMKGVPVEAWQVPLLRRFRYTTSPRIMSDRFYNDYADEINRLHAMDSDGVKLTAIQQKLLGLRSTMKDTEKVLKGLREKRNRYPYNSKDWRSADMQINARYAQFNKKYHDIVTKSDQ